MDADGGQKILRLRSHCARKIHAEVLIFIVGGGRKRNDALITIFFVPANEIAMIMPDKVANEIALAARREVAIYRNGGKIFPEELGDVIPAERFAVYPSVNNVGDHIVVSVGVVRSVIAHLRENAGLNHFFVRMAVRAEDHVIILRNGEKRFDQKIRLRLRIHLVASIHGVLAACILRVGVIVIRQNDEGDFVFVKVFYVVGAIKVGDSDLVPVRENEFFKGEAGRSAFLIFAVIAAVVVTEHGDEGLICAMHRVPIPKSVRIRIASRLHIAKADANVKDVVMV